MKAAILLLTASPCWFKATGAQSNAPGTTATSSPCLNISSSMGKGCHSFPYTAKKQVQMVPTHANVQSSKHLYKVISKGNYEEAFV